MQRSHKQPRPPSTEFYPYSPAQSCVETLNGKSITMADANVLDWAPSLSTPDFKAIEAVLLELEQYLTLRTYLEGYQLSSADKDT
jgi:hypothetical protein